MSHLPLSLKEKIIYNKNLSRLIFLGKMSEEEREILKDSFFSPQDKEAIQRLFEKTQQVF